MHAVNVLSWLWQPAALPHLLWKALHRPSQELWSGPSCFLDGQNLLKDASPADHQFPNCPVPDADICPPPVPPPPRTCAPDRRKLLGGEGGGDGSDGKRHAGPTPPVVPPPETPTKPFPRPRLPLPHPKPPTTPEDPHDPQDWPGKDGPWADANGGNGPEVKGRRDGRVSAIDGRRGEGRR
jgi:hypothetical protein